MATSTTKLSTWSITPRALRSSLNRRRVRRSTYWRRKNLPIYALEKAPNDDSGSLPYAVVTRNQLLKQQNERTERKESKRG